jgi:7-keto-8-aminopelargonate synthetase-like enzyme
MVDDAHAIGVMGKNGRGTSEHFGVEEDVDLVMGTFSKSFASLGGFITGREDTIDYIMHFARSLIFSASMPPANIASVIAALDIIEKEPERRKRLWKNTNRMANTFRKLGFNIGNSQTPIIPIIVGDLMKLLTFWKTLFDNGVYVNPIIPPAVPEGMCLLRTSYMATHTDQMLDRALEIFERTGKKLGVI